MKNQWWKGELPAMEEYRKGLGWILFGMLLALLGLGGPMEIPLLYIGFSAHTLRLLGLLCGGVGISYLYLGDVSRFKNRRD